MSMQQRPSNPIEARKQAARAYSRNAAIWGVGGVAGGVVLAVALSPWWIWLLLGLVVSVAGAGHYWNKVRQVVNHRDEY
ncbi:hypothetical protein [Corynebacterium lowii]|uniref:Uncharacterized protein n=1 Tax=Corynebacterium lowii TaxID=1544413 RepID=A0A0Q0YWH3_9CORY|nr:hypothetical protein [Corynebacterium lowii]KQB86719.1 hypothetical protein Clow_00927 [Corynebacterium lowii]MDP9851405.1 hypothetical protein [Corynebacterium lowii]